MELRHLRYFIAIAEERSFTRAAERLWIAQPGLSTQIRRLETELGVRLFRRHARGIDLTEAGEVFLERARVALSAADAARATGRDLDAGVSGSVKLGLATGVRWRRSPAVIEQFTRHHGGVELTVLEGDGGTLWRDLRDGRLDAAVVDASYGSADLTSIALGAEPWVVLLGTSHRLAGTGPLDAGELDGERIAVTADRDGSSYDRAVTRMLAELGVSAEFVPTGPGPALQSAVARGTTLALTTAPDALHTGVVARSLDPVRTLPFTLLCRHGIPSPALSAFTRVAAADVTNDYVPRKPLAAAA